MAKPGLLIIPAIMSTFIMAGCDSSKDASKANFKRAIDQKLSEKCITFRPAGIFSSGSFPITVEDVQANQFISQSQADKRNGDNQGPLNALVGAGVLEVKQDTVKQGFGNGTVPVHVYTLTDKGKSSRLSEASPFLCLGKYKVDEVTGYTEPGNAGGTTVSKADYTFSPTKVPDWAKAEAVRNAYPSLKQSLREKQEGRAVLVLKNDGWAAEAVSGANRW
ncbi:hypothetical protein [Pantoea vagans]|uniref:hypothetical protein n=1 Tax=Pantoea vagans TaxID=470934 RepID=UPI00366A6190